MNSKNRLIEVLRDIKYAPFKEQEKDFKVGAQFTTYALETIAEALLAAGMLLPPCIVNDTIYVIEGGSTPCISEHVVKKIAYGKHMAWYVHTDQRCFSEHSFGWYVFTDIDEAQEALEKRINHE